MNETKRILRLRTVDGRDSYKCTICGKDLTAAVDLYNRDHAEALHRAVHYMETRDRIVDYAKQITDALDSDHKADMHLLRLLQKSVHTLRNLSP